MLIAVKTRHFHLAATALSTPLYYLRVLAGHEDKHIRRKVAENPTIPVAWLAEMANDEFYEVRIAVAENARTPIPILEMLSEDDHADVRFSMAENANLPLHILSILARDENPYVAERACKTRKRLASESPAKRELAHPFCA